MIENTNFLKIQTTQRDSVEKNLEFLGLLVMENQLKAATKDTISTLNECRIRTIMATGDNTLTAISVGKECNILKMDEPIFFGEVENESLVWRHSEDHSF